MSFMLPDDLEVNVPDHELARLMSWPMDRAFHGPTLELVTEARAIFDERAIPWRQAVQVDIVGIEAPAIRFPGIELTGQSLAEELKKVSAHAAVVLCATAGREIADYTSSLWESDQGDLAFVLASLSSAYAEQSLGKMHEYLCHAATEHHLAVLNPCSPGNDGLDFSAQHGLYKVIAEPSPGIPGEGRVRAVSRIASIADRGTTLTPALSRSTGRGSESSGASVVSRGTTLTPALSRSTGRGSESSGASVVNRGTTLTPTLSQSTGRGSESLSAPRARMPIEILDSGALNPTSSVFAICGITRRLDLAQSTPGYRPCGKCSRRGCSFRRSPYQSIAV